MRILEHKVYLSKKYIKNYLVGLWKNRFGSEGVRLVAGVCSPGLQTIYAVVRLPWQGWRTRKYRKNSSWTEGSNTCISWVRHFQTSERLHRGSRAFRPLLEGSNGPSLCKNWSRNNTGLTDFSGQLSDQTSLTRNFSITVFFRWVIVSGGNCFGNFRQDICFPRQAFRSPIAYFERGAWNSTHFWNSDCLRQVVSRCEAGHCQRGFDLRAHTFLSYRELK